MTTYQRDDQLAVQAEGRIGGRIETSGAYTGRFTLARERIARTGARGIEFTFEADDGRIARYLTLWVARADGSRLDYGYGLLSALMVILGLSTIESKPAVIDEWDPASGQWLPAQVEVFADLMHKPVGVLLQREEREWEGRTQVAMRIVEFFDPRDRRTAGELLADVRQPQVLERLIASLRPTVLRATRSAELAPASGAAPAASFADFVEDDIPF
ncbi:MAG: hypothetical protein N2Z63_07145 [Thiobacillaceae bacterium]|nr:hypothetical protein [Thiobacillaceae bacterium]